MLTKPILKYLLLLLILLAIGLRLYSFTTDFWFDEIWFLNSLEEYTSFWDIFSEFKLYKNHWTISIYTYLLGSDKHWMVYRIPTVLCGILLFLYPLRKNKSNDIFYILILGSSFQIINLSGMARGYIPMLFCSYLNFTLISQGLSKKREHMAFLATFILGFTSQFSFIFYAMALTLYLSICERKKLKWLVIPWTMILLLYFFLISDYEQIIPFENLSWKSSLSVVSSMYLGDGFHYFYFLTTLLILLSGTYVFLKEKDKRLIFYISVFSVPIIYSILTKPSYIVPRYFIVPIYFFLVFFSETLKKRNILGKGKNILYLLLFIYIVSNGYSLTLFLKHGRGKHSQAVHYIKDHSENNDIKIKSNQYFLNNMILSFYDDKVMNEKRITLLKEDVTQKCEWIIFSDFNLLTKGTPVEKINDSITKNNYIYKKSFYSSPLNLMHWHLYKIQKNNP